MCICGLHLRCFDRFDDGPEVLVRAQDLVLIEELGRGAYGVVEKMQIRDTNTIMAVKVFDVSCINTLH
jgi:hypothetical protein